MIVVAIIGLLATIAIPNFVRARNSAQTNVCVNNLKQLDSCIQQWAMATGKKDTDAPIDAEVFEYLKGGIAPVCPAGGNYSLGETVTNLPTCSVAGHVLP